MERYDIVSFEVAKLIKEKGFNEMCRVCYIPRYTHNGKDIDEDEEFELKCEGRENEIEIIEGGSTWEHWNQNNDEFSSVSAPSLWGMMEYLREKYNIHITVKPYVNEDGINFLYEIYTLEPYIFSLVKSKTGFNTNDEAVNSAIEYIYKNLL